MNLFINIFELKNYFPHVIGDYVSHYTREMQNVLWRPENFLCAGNGSIMICK